MNSDRPRTSGRSLHIHLPSSRVPLARGRGGARSRGDPTTSGETGGGAGAVLCEGTRPGQVRRAGRVAPGYREEQERALDWRPRGRLRDCRGCGYRSCGSVPCPRACRRACRGLRLWNPMCPIPTETHHADLQNIFWMIDRSEPANLGHGPWVRRPEFDLDFMAIANRDLAHARGRGFGLETRSPYRCAGFPSVREPNDRTFRPPAAPWRRSRCGDVGYEVIRCMVPDAATARRVKRMRPEVTKTQEPRRECGRSGPSGDNFRIDD